jgi:sugar phosphate isomerase/epimerase
MQAVLFTKLLREQSLPEIAEIGRNLGFDGIDFLIRSGYHVEPEAPEKLREAITTLRTNGIAVPMATTDLTNPGTLPAERLFAECAEAGVKLIRLGYWHYDAQRGYQACFDQARLDLDALEKLARKTGVKLAIQLHGGTIHCSGALTRALLDGHDPAYLGAYADPGNQAVQDGREDWQLTLDLLRPWLCCLGVKNGGWFPTRQVEDGQRIWQSDWLGIADGMVPWNSILAYLAETHYHGLLSFHSHYQMPLEQALAQTEVDLRFVQRQLATQSRG